MLPTATGYNVFGRSQFRLSDQNTLPFLLWEKIKKSKMPQNRDCLIQDSIGQRVRNSNPSPGTAQISSGLVQSNRHC